MGRQIVFLHIPKTAGQAVRDMLLRSFPKKLACPAMGDYQIAVYSKEELNQFEIFAGHYSPSLMDALRDDAFVFTVLRDPGHRIISFHRFIREQARAMSPEALSWPQNAGPAAALRMPFDQFLATQDPNLRTYVRNSLDNFYTYYFGTRRFGARYMIRDIYPDSDYFITEKVLHNAIANIASGIHVYYMDKFDELIRDLSAMDGYQESPLLKINAGAALEGKIRDYCQANSDSLDRTLEYLYIFTQWDWRIFNYFKP